MRRRRVSLRFAVYVLLTIAILALFPLYSHFKEVAAPVPPGVHLAGLDVSHLEDPAAIRAHMEPIYRQPLGVRFQEQILVLYPETVGFAADIDATIAAAARYLEGLDFVDIAVREAIGLPQQLRDVPLRYRVDEARLAAWLEQAAAELDYAPVPPRIRLPDVQLAAPPSASGAAVTSTVEVTASEPVPAAEPVPLAGPAPTPTPEPIRNLEWIAGIRGYKVDVEASIPRVAAALASGDERMVDLVLTEIVPPAPTIADLAEQLPRVLDTFPVFAGVYVRDLLTGEEAQADGDAAFSGMTTLKIALAAALMEALPAGVSAGDPEAQQVGRWLDASIGQGDDAAADQALAWLGGGDATAGARRLTAFVRGLGLENTFMQSGFSATVQLPALTTPSNQRERPNTRPDSNLQTTPQDIGRLLAAIYECTQDQGPLRTVYPNTITPEECRTILFYFTHNELRDAVWRGLPDYETRWIVHQHGLSIWQHGDVALVWGPTGAYVIGVFYFNPDLTSSENANRSVIDLSRMAWDFFAVRRAQGVPAPGEPPALTPPRGYVSIDNYAPSAANPAGQ